MAKVLILCPTFDHADALFASIGSVRAQTFREWEMAVICDGSPERTFEVLEAITAEEPRVKVHRFPKSERYGENHRDPIIRESGAEFVCHLSDDDVWLSSHLAELTAMLERAEWVNQAELRILGSGGAEWRPVNLAASRRGVMIGLNYVAYRRAAYLRLPEGWTCAPGSTPSDKFMWKKFFRDPALTAASSAMATALKFPSRGSDRVALTPEQRLAELRPWLERASRPELAAELRRSASVLNRMQRLFAVHHAEDCDNLDAAFAKAGLAPAEADARPEPAINGAPMVLPLTEAQRREAWLAWAALRAYATKSGDGIRRVVRDALGDHIKTWRDIIKTLAADNQKAGLRAAADFRRAVPDSAEPLVASIEVLIEMNRPDEAAPFLASLEKGWPGRHATARLLERSRAAGRSIGAPANEPSRRIQPPRASPKE